MFLQSSGCFAVLFLLFTLYFQCADSRADASLATVTHAAGDKINSKSNNGITVAGWIESAFDEPTSQERINRGSRRRVLRCAYWCSRVSGLSALIGLCSGWCSSLLSSGFFPI